MKRVMFALAMTSLSLGTNADAVVLSIGTTPISGTTVAANPQLAGIVLEDDVVPFSFAAGGGTVSGSVQSRVVRSSVDGTLDFYWRVINDANSAIAISSFRLGNFVTAVYDGNYRLDGTGDVGPGSVLRFNEPALNFRFDGAGGAAPSTIKAGASSYFMFLDTNATAYARTASYDLTVSDSSEISGLYATFAPVPEPASYALFAGGLAVLALRRRRGA